TPRPPSLPFPTRRSSDLAARRAVAPVAEIEQPHQDEDRDGGQDGEHAEQDRPGHGNHLPRAAPRRTRRLPGDCPLNGAPKERQELIRAPRAVRARVRRPRRARTVEGTRPPASPPSPRW